MSSLLVLAISAHVPRRTLLGGAAAAASCISSPLKPSLASEAAATRVIGRSSGAISISGGPLPLTVGLGTCLVSDGSVTNTMGLGFRAGYRLFDTAQRYGNERGVGRALEASGVHREECFVTTKVWVDNMGSKTTSSVQQPARDLGLSAIDLVLIHWPGKFIKRDGDANDRENQALRRTTWASLERLQRDGVVKRIGVSNFGRRHLEELLEYAEIQPSVNQFEVHPYNTREELVEFCQRRGILVNSYCPIGGRGNKGQSTDELLKDKTLVAIGASHGKTAAQVILRWHLQRGLTPIPKATSKAHVNENFGVFDFALNKEEIAAISALNRNKFALFDADALA